MRLLDALRTLAWLDSRLLWLAKQYAQLVNEIGVFRGMRGRRTR